MTERDFPFDPEPREPEIIMIAGQAYEVVGESDDGCLAIMPAELAHLPINSSDHDKSRQAAQRQGRRQGRCTRVSGAGEP